jgi:glycosyltransferase involved in cell wall biosynthesis
VLGLLRHLDPRRYEPVIVPQRADGAIARLFRENGMRTETPLRWTELPYDSRVGAAQALRVLKDVVPQVRFLRSRSCRIVHSNDGRTHATWALPARLSGARLLWHQRGDPNAAGLRLAAPLLADRVVAVSAFASPKPGLWSAARKSRVVHSPFATDIEEDRERARADLVEEIGCDPNTAFMGYFGAFSSRKRPYLFIDAIAELAGRSLSRPVIGLMFGEAYDGGRTEAGLRRHAQEKGVADMVRQMGFRTPGPRWLAGCDMLLVPAVGEPFGRTLIEAMLVGTPVVATASGGNREALCDGTIGMLVPPENARALADAAAILIDWPAAAAAMAAAASADARRRFGEERHAAQLMAIYDEMLGVASAEPAAADQRRQPAGTRRPTLENEPAS